jgi:Glycerate kinase family
VAERRGSAARRAAIPRAALLVASPFAAGLSAQCVVAAIADGLEAGGHELIDACPLDGAQREAGVGLRELLAALDFDARMRAARALIVAEPRLDERTVEGSAAFELATRARQAGVPCYAVTARNELNAFDARVLDLQLIIEAGNTRALAAAGRELARVL